ncbi:hypothetical protein FRB94_003743 [Tulasnella sp. JGI-2019a]|nr:hypothetical protein FRB94_003743 [Tulasnella sp. JGI-2019a]
MSQQYLFRLSRTFPSHQLRPTMATSASFSFRLARKTLKTPPDPGRYSTYASMTRPLLSSQVGAGGIPHPSTYAVKPSEEPKTFESPSRPRPIYQRPKFATRELPVITVSHSWNRHGYLGRPTKLNSFRRGGLFSSRLAREWSVYGRDSSSTQQTKRGLRHPSSGNASSSSNAPKTWN